MTSSLNRAIQLRNDGEFDEAIDLMRNIIAEQPGASEPYRRLADWLAQLEREDELRDLLRNWSTSARGLDRLEPLVRLRDRLEGGRSAAEAAERELVKARLASSKSKLLSRIGADRDGRLKILIAARDAAGIVDLLSSGTPEANTALKPNLLLGALRILDGTGQALPPIRQVLDVDALCQANNPNLLAHLARVADQAGENDLAMRIDSRLSEQDVQFENSFVRIAQQLTNRRRFDELGDLLAKWAGRFPDSPRCLRFEIEYELSRSGLDQAIAIGRRLVAQQGGNAADYLRLSDLLLKNNEDQKALAVVTSGVARFPGNAKLLARAWQISSRLGEEAAATAARRQAQLYQDLDHAFVEAIGEDALLACGGRSFIHSAFDNVAGADTATDGLLDLADLALTSLRHYVAVRPGRRREAAELRPLGAAQWEALEPRAEKLARFVLALCQQALLRRPDDTRALCTALETILLMEWGGAVAVSLCQALLPHYKSLGGIQRDWMWRIVLGLPASDESVALRARLVEAEPARGQNTHYLQMVPAPEDVPAAAGTALLDRPAREVRTPIRALSDLGDVAVDLTVRVSETLAFGPVEARIWAGCFVEREPGRVMAPDTTPGVIRRDAVVAASGARGLLLRKPDAVQTIDEPLLFVPGTHAHYGAYFHFLGQVLPVIVRMRKLLRVPGLRIGIPDSAPRFVHDLLTLARIDPAEILLLPRTQTVEVRELYTLTPCALDFQAEPDDLALLRDCLRKPRSRRRRTRKLFLSRPLSAVNMAGRSLVNEVELEQLAQARGYEAVNPLAFSLADQRDLFASAAVLCGPTGAALANCLFMPGDGELICLSPRQTCRTYYPGMTLGSDQRFTWVLGSFLSGTEGARDFPHLPYSVPPEVLERAL